MYRANRCMSQRNIIVSWIYISSRKYQRHVAYLNWPIAESESYGNCTEVDVRGDWGHCHVWYLMIITLLLTNCIKLFNTALFTRVVVFFSRCSLQLFLFFPNRDSSEFIIVNEWVFAIGWVHTNVLSRLGKMKREERDLCWLPTSFLLRMRSRFLNNQWRFCYVRHNPENQFEFERERERLLNLSARSNFKWTNQSWRWNDLASGRCRRPHCKTLRKAEGTFLFEEKAICRVTSGQRWMEWFPC